MRSPLKRAHLSIIVSLAAAGSAVGHAAAAAEYLAQVQSEVYQSPGAQRDLAAKGATCIAKHLASGRQAGELIVSRDDAGVVANSVVEYPDGLVRWTMRSTVSFEAREGRFRITQTNIERFNDTLHRWDAVGKWRFSGGDKAESVLVGINKQIADCVRGATPKDDF